MKSLKVLTLIVLLMAIAVPSAIFAQDDDTETVTFEEENGWFTFDHSPELEYFPELLESDPPFTFFGFADSEETGTASSAFELLPEGGWGLGVGVFPKAIFAEMGMDEDASIADIAQAFMVAQFSEGDENLSEEQIADMMEMMEIETVELEDESEAAQIDLPAESEDNLVVLFEPSEGVIVLMSLLTGPGARTDEQIESWMASVNSFEFLASAEDLMMDMDTESE